MRMIHVTMSSGSPPQIIILEREGIKCEVDPPVGTNGTVIRLHGDHLDAYRASGDDHGHTWQCGKLVTE